MQQNYSNCIKYTILTSLVLQSKKTKLTGHRWHIMGLCMLISSVLAHIDLRRALKANLCALTE